MEDIERALRDAQRKASETARYFARLKTKKPRDLDLRVNRLHAEVFASIDCLACGNCCRAVGPKFNSADVGRAATALHMTAVSFTKTYLREDEEGDRVLKSLPCPFLMDDNRCFIHEERPRACAEYPHTDGPVHGILNLTQKNALACPGVFRIFERLRRELPL